MWHVEPATIHLTNDSVRLDAVLRAIPEAGPTDIDDLKITLDCSGEAPLAITAHDVEHVP
jgi:hypothetical protein